VKMLAACLFVAAGIARAGSLLQEASPRAAARSNPLEGQDRARRAGAKLFDRQWRRRPWKSPAAPAKSSLRCSAWSIVLDPAQRIAQPWHAILRAFARTAAVADYYLAPDAAVAALLNCCCPGPSPLTPESGSQTSHWIHRPVRPRRTAYSAAPNW
jgi:hypothetical protein